MQSSGAKAQEVEWIRSAQRGNSEAFGLLVEKYQQRVFGLVYHLVHRRDEVEDLAQEIFIKAFRAIRSYNFQSSFITWLSRIGTNHCYDYLRHERISRIAASPGLRHGSCMHCRGGGGRGPLLQKFSRIGKVLNVIFTVE